jgi:hypothetical protein
VARPRLCTDLKRENRDRIRTQAKSPASLIDVLSIVEHPAFQSLLRRPHGREVSRA